MALFLALALVSPLVPVSARATVGNNASLALLTHVNEVRRLTSVQAKQRYPVRVEGVVTALSGWRNSFFLQDATAGISVDRNDVT